MQLLLEGKEPPLLTSKMPMLVRYYGALNPNDSITTYQMITLVSLFSLHRVTNHPHHPSPFILIFHLIFVFAQFTGSSVLGESAGLDGSGAAHHKTLAGSQIFHPDRFQKQRRVCTFRKADKTKIWNTQKRLNLVGEF